ncbi:MAG: tryptophan--tRNA ligase [Epsilonproteobacteria bacterium]|nr:tryptophan--tRNA ligase [Campylobacterota bacterium]
MRVVSGMRPTGKLHLGHYIGVIKNWKELQQRYECFYFVADWHALTTKFDDLGLDLKKQSIELVKEWIACGIDPQKVNLFIQSAIKEHAELYLIFNMITPVSWLERNPTYKDAMQQEEYKKKNNAGFLTYPVLQTADIVLYDADLVPIGEDQKPHLELARDIVNRFNYLYKVELFKEPKELLTEVPRLPGLDGRKMSKSFNNAIYLDESTEEIWNKVRMAKTDPARIKKTDPGHPDVCIVFDYHKAFSSKEEVEEIQSACKAGSIGCVECKKRCAANIEKVIAPIREKKSELKDEEILDIINQGNMRAKEMASAKMAEVNKIIF